MYNLDSKQKILTSCIRKFCTTVNLHKSSPRQGSLIIYKAYLDCCFSRGRLVFSFHKYCIEISFFIPQLLAWLLIIHDLYITITHHFTSQISILQFQLSRCIPVPSLSSSFMTCKFTYLHKLCIVECGLVLYFGI